MYILYCMVDQSHESAYQRAGSTPYSSVITHRSSRYTKTSFYIAGTGVYYILYCRYRFWYRRTALRTHEVIIKI